MLKIEAEATITYTCTLSEDDEVKVREYIVNNPDDFEFMSEEKSLAKSAEILYNNGEIDLYECATESDFSTEDVRYSEFND